MADTIDIEVTPYRSERDTAFHDSRVTLDATNCYPE